MDYSTLNGETLALNLDAQERRYFDRLQAAGQDVAVDVDGLVDLIYSQANPVLEAGPVPGRGYVTRAVFQRPVYRACLDLLERKHKQQRSLDPDELRAEFSVPAKAAAEQLGLGVRSVQLAIQEGRLRGLRLGRGLFTTPAAVAAYQAGNQGPASRVELRAGSAPGLSLSYKTDGETEQLGKDGRVLHVAITGWSWILVRTTKSGTQGEKTVRLFVLRPQRGRGEEMRLGPLGFAGPLMVVKKLSGPKAVAGWSSPSGVLD